MKTIEYSLPVTEDQAKRIYEHILEETERFVEIVQEFAALPPALYSAVEPYMIQGFLIMLDYEDVDDLLECSIEEEQRKDLEGIARYDASLAQKIADRLFKKEV